MEKKEGADTGGGLMSDLKEIKDIKKRIIGLMSDQISLKEIKDIEKRIIRNVDELTRRAMILDEVAVTLKKYPDAGDTWVLDEIRSTMSEYLNSFREEIVND